MASRDDYARWLYSIIEDDTHHMEDIMEAMIDDGYIDDYHEWVSTDEDEEGVTDTYAKFFKK